MYPTIFINNPRTKEFRGKFAQYRTAKGSSYHGSLFDKIFPLHVDLKAQVGIKPTWQQVSRRRRVGLWVVHPLPSLPSFER